MTRIEIIRHFLSGAIFMGSMAIGVYFLRLWKTQRDLLFAFFAAAFWVFALERILMIVIQASEDQLPFVYMVRWLGFALILSGIVTKNLSR